MTADEAKMIRAINWLFRWRVALTFVASAAIALPVMLYIDATREARYDRRQAEQAQWLRENDCRVIGYENRWLAPRTLFICKDGEPQLILVLGPRITYIDQGRSQ